MVLTIGGGVGIMGVAVVVTALAVITLVELLYLGDCCCGVVYNGGGVYGGVLKMEEREENYDQFKHLSCCGVLCFEGGKSNVV